MRVLREMASENDWEKIEDALEPPNRVNPLTGLPYGWDEDDELAGLDDLLTA